MRMAPTNSGARDAPCARPIDDARPIGRAVAYQEIVKSRHFQYRSAAARSMSALIEKIDLHLDLIGVSTAATAGKPPLR